MVDCMIRDGAEVVETSRFPSSPRDTVYPPVDGAHSGERYRVARTAAGSWVVVKPDLYYPGRFSHVRACTSVHIADLEILESLGEVVFTDGGPGFEVADLKVE